MVERENGRGCRVESQRKKAEGRERRAESQTLPSPVYRSLALDPRPLTLDHSAGAARDNGLDEKDFEEDVARNRRGLDECQCIRSPRF